MLAMSAETNDYSALALEHFRAPLNSGQFVPGTPRALSGKAGSERQGREVQFALRLDEAGRVAECRYQVYGDPATVAVCSLLSERLIGLTPEEARDYRVIDLARELSLPAEKHAAALVAEDAVRAALRGYNRGQASPNA